MTGQEKQTVLIVDDEPVNIKVLGQALSDIYRVKTAINGSKALDICTSSDAPDLVLLDIQMPDIDGYEVLIRLREQEKTKSLPLIFITGRDAAEDEARGLELGAMDYITKPFNIPVVMARVRNQLALKKKADLLEMLVSIDGLTEIPNRRQYDETFRREWRRGFRASAPLSMVMIDIDCFKAFNDHYGHSKGDQVLKVVAETLNNAVQRGADFVARYGGEEFVALLPDTDAESAKLVAERLRAAVVNAKIPHEYNKAGSYITISVGVASATPSSLLTQLDLQDKADEMLYKAKHAGRNQVAAAEPNWDLGSKAS